MACTIAELPKGTRITDYISLGVLATTFPLPEVKAVLAAQKKTSRRQALPSLQATETSWPTRPG